MNEKFFSEIYKKINNSGVEKSFIDQISTFEKLNLSISKSTDEVLKSFNNSLDEAFSTMNSLSSFTQLAMKEFSVINESMLAAISPKNATSFLINDTFETLQKSIKASGFLEAISIAQAQGAQIEKLTSFELIEVLRHFEKDRELFESIRRIGKEFEENNEIRKEFFVNYESLFNLSEIKHSSLFVDILNWIELNFTEIKEGLTKKLIANLFFIYLGFLLTKPLDTKSYEINECIIRNGCRLRTLGTTNSKIVTIIPKGEKVLILEDGGRWKKIQWQSKSKEIFEGWIFCNLLKNNRLITMEEYLKKYQN